MKRKRLCLIIIGILVGFAANAEEPPTLTIKQIQGEQDASPYAGFVVYTEGIVTSLDVKDYEDFYIQDGSGAWNGIKVYHPNYHEDNDLKDKIKVGNKVLVRATVTEFYELTELNSVEAVVVTATEQTLPEPLLLNTGELTGDDAEKYESVMVMIKDAVCQNEPSTYVGDKEKEMDDGSGICRIDDHCWRYYNHIDMNKDSAYDVKGVVHFSFGFYKIEPMSTDDICFSSENCFPTGINKTQIRQNLTIINNPNLDYIQFKSEKPFNSIIIINLLGQTVLKRTYNHEKMATINTSQLKSNIYLCRINFINGGSAVRKIIVGK
jgi:hypothetical protein